ncbi:hypothetical protein B0T17DRAFT_545513 [Bombardia bombarda]|uniref:Uncharacterized protein n=1 Tax=Bombardia bombarda TaxID=252184 RepID=A0AA39W9P5_9PEZI|nr:hypothetical protein B0T17DRAFT_545513 [Bombardia bombarda]
MDIYSNICCSRADTPSMVLCYTKSHQTFAPKQFFCYVSKEQPTARNKATRSLGSQQWFTIQPNKSSFEWTSHPTKRGHSIERRKSRK